MCKHWPGVQSTEQHLAPVHHGCKGARPRAVPIALMAIRAGGLGEARRHVPKHGQGSVNMLFVMPVQQHGPSIGMH
jgi:hypothetical protein